MRPFRPALAAGLLLLARPLVAQEWKVPSWARLIPVDQLKVPGPATSEVLGYPAVTVDKTVIRLLLLEGKFDELERTFARLQDSTRVRIQREYDLVDANGAFDSPDTLLGPALARWNAVFPASSHARVALATWHLARAFRAASDGSAGMQGERDAALTASREALAIDSASYLAWCITLDGLVLTGDRDAALAAFNAAYTRYPASHYLVRLYLKRLRPRWGGDYPSMTQFIARILPDTVVNIRLRTYQGAVEGDLAEIMAENDAPGALRHANAALRYGPEFYYLVDRGHAFLHTGDYVRAVADLGAALGQRPQYVLALQHHATAVSSSAQWDRGGRREAALRQEAHDYESVLAFDPVDAYTVEQLAAVRIELAKCPEFKPECGGEEKGPVYVVRQTFADLDWWLATIGIGSLLSWVAVIRWLRSGKGVPFYVHVLALAGFLTIGYAQYLWVQSGAPMTLRRWVLTFTIPLLVYVLFIGLGGASAAAKRTRSAPR